MFSNLLSSIKNTAQKVYNTGKSILSSAGSAIQKGGLKGLTSSVINAVKPQQPITGPTGPYSNIVGVDPITGKPNMTVMANKTLSSGAQAYVSPTTGRTSVLNEFGETSLIPTLRLASGALNDKGQSVPLNTQQLNDIIQSTYRSSVADTFGRFSTPEYGTPFSVKGENGKSIYVVPKAGFSGLAGQVTQGDIASAGSKSGSTFNSLFGSTGLSGAAGGSASTGLLTGTSGLNTPYIPGQIKEEDEERNIQTRETGSQVLPSIPGQGGINPAFLAGALGGGQALQSSSFQAPQFQVQTPSNVIDASSLGTTNSILSNNLSSIPELQQEIAQGFAEQKALINQTAPLPTEPVADTIAQADFINQSADPFGVKKALDDFRKQNTNLGDLQKQRVDILKDIQALNASYRPIFESIKNNPNLPKALAIRRLEAVNKSHKEILQGFIDQQELINQSISDQNEIVNRAFNIVELAESREEKTKNRLASQLNLFVSTGAIGGFTDSDIQVYAQALGIPPKTLVAMRTAANQPKIEIKGSVEDGFTQFSIDKSGNVSTKQLTKPIVATNGSSTIFQQLKQFPDSRVSWMGQSLINIVNNTYSKDQVGRITDNALNAINNGDLEGLRNQIQTYAYNQLSAGQQEDFKNTEVAVGTAEYTSDLLSSKQVNFGPYKTYGEALKPWLNKQKDQNYVELLQMIEMAQSPIRLSLYGTALTATEKANADRFLINPQDDSATVATKLDGFSKILRWRNDVILSLKTGAPRPNIADYVGGVQTSSSTSLGNVVNQGKTSSGVGYKVIQN